MVSATIKSSCCRSCRRGKPEGDVAQIFDVSLRCLNDGDVAALATTPEAKRGKAYFLATFFLRGVSG